MNQSTFKKKKGRFEITLLKGKHFQSLERDYETIYLNFSLLSYVNREYQLKIIDHSVVDNVQIDEFETNRGRYYLIQKQKPHFDWDVKIPRTYQIRRCKNLNIEEEKIEIKAIFKSKVIEDRQYIFIEIEDQQNWLEQSLIQYGQVFNKKKKQDKVFYDATLLSEGCFKNIQGDYETIYKSFSFVQYLSREYKLKIQQKYGNSNVFFQTDGKQFYLIEKIKNKFHQNIQIHILYEIWQNQNQKQKQCVYKKKQFLLKFKKTTIGYRDYITFSFEDEKGFIQSNFQKKSNSISQRLSEHRSLRPNQLEYYYNQPKKQRSKRFSYQHLSIALQGGGAKGIAYTGISDVLKETLKKIKGYEVPIRSIIGSSAGSILGLAICCGLREQEIIDLAINPLSNITKDDKNFKENNREKEARQLKKIKQLLQEYDIFEEEVYYFIENLLKNERLRRAFLEIVRAFNPSLVDLFSFTENNEENATIYGALMASLMSGDVIKTISKNFLNKFRQNYNEKNPDDPIEDVQNWGENVTLSRLYELNQIEFTCTSVDLRDHILRFFNHKTTPKLPVCKAVQMSGSFPVAFKSQEWDKDWGKYYVHYCNTRKEIDLEGVKFTDGGMLANFPVKYLDNEEMRPMYFSHENNENTLIYGFGFQQLSQRTKQKKQKLKNAISAFKSQFNWSLVSWKTPKILLKWGRRQMSSGINSVIDKVAFWKEEKQNEEVDILENIPLLKFCTDLLQTYIKSKDNLTLECFYNSIFFIPIENGGRMMGPYDCEKFTKQFERIYKNFIEMIHEKRNNQQSPVSKVIKNLKYLQQKIERTEITQEELIFYEKKLRYLFSYYSLKILLDSEEQFKERFGIKQSDLINETFFYRIIKLEQIKNPVKQNIFYNCHLREDFYRLRNFLQDGLKYFTQVNEDHEGEVQKKIMNFYLEKIEEEENKKIEQIKILLDQHRQKIGKYEYTSFGQGLINCLCEISLNYITVLYEDSESFTKELQQCHLHELQVSLKMEKAKQFLRQYIVRKIEDKSQESKNIHLVLHSGPHAQKYFHNCYMEVNKTLKMHNVLTQKRDYQISSITSSNFYSLAAFLHASDLPAQKVEKEIWNIQNIIETYPKIEEDFSTQSWCKISKLKINELEQEVMKNQEKIFQLIQEQLNHQKYYSNSEDVEIIDKNLLNFKESLEKKAQISKDQINQAIQKSMYYVIDEVEKIREKVQKGDIQSQDYIKTISERLSVKIQNPYYQKDYLQQTKSENQKIRNLIQFFIGKYEEIFINILNKTPNVKQAVLTHLHDHERHLTLKGLVLCELLTYMKLKFYIYEKLKEMGLKKQTTLKEFYELSSKKIHLNFTAVQKPANLVTIINHKTRPEMPVWAAIVATCALPFMFRPLLERKEWKYIPAKTESERLAKSYFSKPEPEASYLQSADLMMKLPLELVTNNKIQSLITDKKNEIFLTFGFIDKHEQQIPKITKPKTNRMGLGQLAYTYFFRFPKDLKNLLSIPLIEERMDVFNFYMVSHDNLIKNIYEKQLIILPIRLGTLDFHEMTKDGELTEKADDAIYQGKYVTKQQVQNGLKKDEDRKFYIKFEKRKKQMKIRFLSMFDTVKSFPQRSKIFYKRDGVDQRYHSLSKEELSFSQETSAGTVSFKIAFPLIEQNQSVKIAKVCHQMNFKNLLEMEEQNWNYTFRFSYNRLNYFYKANSFENDEVKIEIQSFFDEQEPEIFQNKSDICSKCFNKIKKTNPFISQEKCFSSHTTIKETQYKIECQNCKTVFCLQCKFRPIIVKKEKLVCPFGHEFKKNKLKAQSYGKDHNISFIICDYCEKGEKQLIYFKQSECGLDLCKTCAFNISVNK